MLIGAGTTAGLRLVIVLSNTIMFLLKCYVAFCSLVRKERAETLIMVPENLLLFRIRI
jgi:hypothetical protein